MHVHASYFLIHVFLFRIAYRPRRYFYILSKMHHKAIEVREDGHLVVNTQHHHNERQLFYEDDTGILRCKFNDFAIDVPGGRPI